MDTPKTKETQFIVAWVVFIVVNLVATYIGTLIVHSMRDMAGNPDTRTIHGILHLMVSLLGMAVSYFSYKLTVTKFVLPRITTPNDSDSSKPAA